MKTNKDVLMTIVKNSCSKLVGEQEILEINEQQLKTIVSELQPPKVCYVIECSSGVWDDYHTWIEGVFLDVFDAEKLKLDIETKIKIDLESPCPFDDLDYLTKEQETVYYKWLDKVNRANEFGEAKIKEYPLGKSIR